MVTCGWLLFTCVWLIMKPPKEWWQNSERCTLPPPVEGRMFYLDVNGFLQASLIPPVFSVQNVHPSKEIQYLSYWILWLHSGFCDPSVHPPLFSTRKLLLYMLFCPYHSLILKGSQSLSTNEAKVVLLSSYLCTTQSFRSWIWLTELWPPGHILSPCFKSCYVQG